MQPPPFDTLRDLVLHHAARRGWLTQRHVAVICGLDESALSRFLNGEQDIGARRTHALFQAVGVPVEQYDLAYALLARAQEAAADARRSRLRHASRSGQAVEGQARIGLRDGTSGAMIDLSGPWGEDDIPAAVLAARFAAEGLSGAQIAAFFS
jgi:transcriptional regulator with XRE-family HTH domain